MREPPKQFDYSPWRHGGWYVNNVRYASGAVGCVSRNYEDRKWRIACDPRPFESRPTFKTRDEAAAAEWRLAEIDRCLKPGATIAYTSYGQPKVGVVDRYTKNGIVFLVGRRWLHWFSVLEVGAPA